MFGWLQPKTNFHRGSRQNALGIPHFTFIHLGTETGVRQLEKPQEGNSAPHASQEAEPVLFHTINRICGNDPDSRLLISMQILHFPRKSPAKTSQSQNPFCCMIMEYFPFSLRWWHGNAVYKTKSQAATDQWHFAGKQPHKALTISAQNDAGMTAWLERLRIRVASCRTWILPKSILLGRT